MEETRGAMSGEFQPLNQNEDDTSPDTEANTPKISVHDPLGVSHWPGFLKYLENNFAFSAALLSIIGYVVIAAFGAMASLGQYLGYILFVCGVVFVYNLNKRDKRWLYFFIIVCILLAGFIVIQNWSLIADIYHYLGRPFDVYIQAA